MGTTDVYKGLAVAAVAGVVSWVLSLETLFLLGFIAALGVAVIAGSLMGMMALTERMSEEFARERASWRNVRAGANISHH